MAGSMKRIWVWALLMPIALSACVNSQAVTGSATDRLKPQAAACARALAGDSMPGARAACLPHLAQVEAALDW